MCPQSTDQVPQYSVSYLYIRSYQMFVVTGIIYPFQSAFKSTEGKLLIRVDEPCYMGLVWFGQTGIKTKMYTLLYGVLIQPKEPNQLQGHR